MPPEFGANKISQQESVSERDVSVSCLQFQEEEIMKAVQVVSHEPVQNSTERHLVELPFLQLQE